MTFTPEIITGLISLGSGAFAGLMANNQKMLLASIDATKEMAQIGNANANDAAKRNREISSFLQRVCGIIIVGVTFLGPLLIALAYWDDIPTTYIYQESRGRFLGIFGSGGEKIKSMTAEGFVIPPYFKYCVISVTNFLFGASVVKLRRV